MGTMAKNFQEPKGTRDFYPDAMVVRRYIEDAWRRVTDQDVRISDEVTSGTQEQGIVAL